MRQLLERAENEERNEFTEDCHNLLARMERHGISFSGEGTPSYSWYALYVALTDPIRLFQQLLMIKPLDDEFYYTCSLEALKSLLSKNNQAYFVSHFEKSEAAVMRRAGLNIHSPEDFRKFVDEYPGAIDKGEYQQSLKSKLMQELTHNITACFAMTRIPKPRQPLTIGAPIVMQRVCHTERKGNNASINIDIALLRGLLELGQIDRVMEGIRGKIEDIAAGQWHDIWRTTSRAEDYALAFDRLANWFTKCKTPLITAFDQLPRYVGAIVALDIKHRQGMFSDRLLGKQLQGLPQKLSTRDVALITSHLFYHSLTHNVFPWAFIKRAFLHKPVIQSGVESCLKEASEYINAHADVQPLPMTIMSSWQDRSQLEQAVERIKKVPNYLKSGAKRGELMTYKWISEQRTAGISGEAPWPIDTPFPLPLWADLVLTTFDNNA